MSRCLAKDPEDRWQTAHDVAAELQWIANASSASAIAPLPGGRRIKRERLAWGIAGLALVAAVAAGVMSFAAARAPRETLRASIAPPAGASFSFIGRAAGSLALSPDGRHLVVAIHEQGAADSLWIRSLDAATEITHRWPWFLPDGKRFVYLTAQGTGLAARGTIWLASLDRPGRTSLVQSLTNAIPAAGRLLFVRDGMLLSQKLDLRAEALTVVHRGEGC